MTSAKVVRIANLGLVVADLDRACDFYTGALGFEEAARGGDADRVARLRLGAQEIELLAPDPPGRPYPEPRRADDPWFQHFAIAVSDMEAAWRRLCEAGGAQAISRGGPQLLPPSTGSVTACKFRDPDGHPLELSLIPGSAWLERPPAGAGPIMSPFLGPCEGPFLGVDHTALAVADLERSVDFYTGLGFEVGGRFLNQGPEQDRLDGLDGVELDIVVLTTPEPGPHIELLHYRSPRLRLGPGPAVAIGPHDVAATRTRLEVRAADTPSGATLRDPDGHLLELTSV